MSNIVAQTITDHNLAGPGHIPPKDLGLKRYPFLFLIDVSGSTGMEPDPDINHINIALHDLLEGLKNPIPSSELAKNTNKIDVAVVAYSDSVMPILDWSTVANLPSSIGALAPIGGTATGKALKYAISLIGHRLNFYKGNAVAFGMPHIIHLTDGCMNDMKPGEPLWNEIKSQIESLDGTTNPEKRVATLINFMSPKGSLAQGRSGSGQDLLMQLAGKKSLFDMNREVATFDQLVQLVTVIITKVTQNFGAAQAIDSAKNTVKADAPAIQKTVRL